MYSLALSAHSEVGRIRKNNQDAAYASPSLIVVCDGMGGAAAGDLASAVAATEAQRSDKEYTDLEQAQEAIAGVIARANARLGDLVEEDLTIDGMGTTFCGGFFTGESLAVGHIGDSRGYLLRDGALTQFTHDHSWVQQLIDEGKITEEQAATHPHRSLILKVLNGQEGFDPDLFTLDLQEGDRILLCSDGLSGLVSDDDMAAMLITMERDEAVEELAKAANDGGGHDNITLIIADVVPRDDALQAVEGTLFGSATEVRIPRIGERAMAAGKPGGYPTTSASPAETETEQEPDEIARYAPKEASRKWPGLLAAFVAIALVIGGGAWGINTYAQSRWFIASDSGEVAVFNGLPGNILGYQLSRLTERTDILVEDLPAFHQRAVRNTIAVADPAAARVTTDELRRLAERCREVRAERLAPQQTEASPSPSPTSTMPGLPMAPGTPEPDDIEVGYPTYLAPMTPTATAEADPESC